jgi:hypothetical protein
MVEAEQIKEDAIAKRHKVKEQVMCTTLWSPII